jgi:hypothetical protein
MEEIELAVYDWAPTDGGSRHVDANAGDVVLVAAMFGAPPNVHVDPSTVLIEDHSHDPTSTSAFSSTAAFAFASLRKTLPLPDGGVLWSPRELPVPAEAPTTAVHDQAVLMRLSAMTLKLLYLGGADVSKDAFRAMFAQGEDAIGWGDISGISAFSRARIGTMPVDRWRRVRADNLAAFSEALGDVPGIDVLDAPFAGILVFDDSSRRDAVRDALVSEDIYPTVLWPLDTPAVADIPEAHAELARRMLTIHCDQRYSADDMSRVAAMVRQAAQAA